MSRSLLVLDVLLACAIAVLLWYDRDLDSRREASRAFASRFHTILDEATPTPASIRRLEIRTPGADKTWVLERRKAGRADTWRYPGWRDAFALPDAVEGLLKAFLEGRGTIAGGLAKDGARLGFSPGRSLDVRMFDSVGGMVLHAIAGDVAPGQRADECFVAASASDRVLILDTNPFAAARIEGTGALPPLVDTHVIPLATGRSIPAKIAFSGPEAPPLGPILRRDTPMEEMQRTMGRAPRYQWFAATADGEKRLNDEAAAAYLALFATLSFDDLLGPARGREAVFAEAPLRITLSYDGGASDTLTLGAKDSQGRFHISNGTTNQAFLISPGKAAALHPDVRALLEPPASAPTTR